MKTIQSSRSFARNAPGVRRAYHGGVERNRPSAAARSGSDSGVTSRASLASSLAAASRQVTQSPFVPRVRPQAGQVRFSMRGAYPARRPGAAASTGTVSWKRR